MIYMFTLPPNTIDLLIKGCFALAGLASVFVLALFLKAVFASPSRTRYETTPR